MFPFTVPALTLFTLTIMFARRQWFITIGFRGIDGWFIILSTGFWFGTVFATAGYNRKPLIFLNTRHSPHVRYFYVHFFSDRIINGLFYFRFDKLELTSLLNS